MMAKRRAAGGGGGRSFLFGALLGLVLSAAALAALSLSTPVETPVRAEATLPPPDETLGAAPTLDAPAEPEVAEAPLPDEAPVVETAPEPLPAQAPELADAPPATAPDDADLGAPVETEAEPDVTQMATEAPPQSPPDLQDDAEERAALELRVDGATPGEDRPEAGEPSPLLATDEAEPVEEEAEVAALETREDDEDAATAAGDGAAAPRRSAWRANAAEYDAGLSTPLVGLVLAGVEAEALRALPAATLTVEVDPDAPEPAAVIAAAREQGAEATLAAARAAAAGDAAVVELAATPGVVGLSLGEAADAVAPSAAALSAAIERGLLAILPPAPAGEVAENLLADTRVPTARPDLVIPAEASGELAFQTLREAGRRAAAGETPIVRLEASPATLAALARWREVEREARTAPVSAIVRRRGDTRY